MLKKIKLYPILFFCLFMSFGSTSFAKDSTVIVDASGFEYDYENHIYVTRKDALQRLFGFNRAYDYMATVLSMVIDAEPIPFFYRGNWYMIELWKGQYYASTGAEIGFYHKSIIDGHWSCANDQQMIQMSYTLKKDGNEIFSRSGIHWWLTGFKPGLFSNPNELSLENIKIDFNEPGMGEAFYNAARAYFSPQLSELEYKLKFVSPNTVTFRWEKPKKIQDHLEKRKYYQILNRTSATALFLFMNPDYSPENFDRKLELIKDYLKFLPINVDNILGFVDS